MAEDMIPKPGVGKIIHYQETTHCVAAIITEVVGGEDNEVIMTLFGILNTTPYVQRKFGTSPGTWHWPERV
jgi:hypothetical protein